MNSSKNIKKIYSQKIKKIKKHNELYFSESRPEILDSEYDKLKKEVIELEKKYNFLNDKFSTTNKVGFRPSKNFIKSKHRARMLSLSNVFNQKDLINFEKKINNFLNFKQETNFEYSVEPKIDGISASLTYKNGILISGASRGDGKEGELITENLKTIIDIPKKISRSDFPEDIDIRGEVFITNKDFKNIEENFANPRNAASGSLRQKNPNETKKIPLKFIAYTFGYFDKNKFKKQSDFLNALNRWGFVTSKFSTIISGVENLINYHEEFEKKRFELEYDVDGLVYKINEFDLQKRLGFVGNAPRWAIAHKFSAISSFSEILNIDIQVGRTGALTPVAKIKPVNVGGVVVSNASLHNEDEINRKDIRIGDTVKIERAGDVIPHVIAVDLSKRKKNSKKYKFPNKCPSCGSQVEKEFNNLTKKYDAVRRCSSEGFKCEKISIEKIKHFISKEALNIDGLGKKVVENFWNLKFVRFPQDIFKLDFSKIEKLDGWGKLSTSNLKYSIENSKIISLDKFIYSLGIRHIGQENAKLIAQHIKTVDNFYKLLENKNFDSILNIDGIGETQIKSFQKFFSHKSNLEAIKDLKKHLTIKQDVANLEGKFKNKTFMLTGKFEGMSRAEAKSLIEKHSGKILSTVSNKLNYLIIGSKPTNRKINQARDLKIKLIDQKELQKMLN